MNRGTAALGSLVFFLVAPVVVSGWMPYQISHWERADGLPAWWPVIAALGWLLVAAGVLSLVAAFVRFVMEGRGTPAPIAPPSDLVVGGQYAWVRNPMYVANIAALLGQAAVFGRVDLLAYAVAVGLIMYGFVRLHEEPALTAKFGEQYAEYRHRVPGWLPRRPR